MKRKLFAFSFILILIIGFFTVSLSSTEMRYYEDNDSVTVFEGAVYCLAEDGEHYYVKDYFATDELAATATKIVLVSEIDGKPVKGIAVDYLYNESYPRVDVITIPEGIEYIGEKAFSALDGVKKIKLPETVSEIGKGAFSDMDSLTEATLPSGITQIAEDLFLSSARLAFVKIGGEITEIGDYAFAGCRRLSSFEIPESVTLIGEAAFRSTALTDVFIPAQVSFADVYSCFKDCTALKRVEFEERKNERFVLNEYFFSGCSSLEEVILPDGGEIIICEGAFENCKDLKIIENTERISVIGSKAFFNCGLETVVLPPDIEYKNYDSGEGAVSVFEKSEKLTRVVFEGEAEEFILPEKMFKDCTALARVMLPLTEKGITLSEKAFYGCRSLLGVYNTATVCSIGKEAYSGCTALEKFILPEGVTSIPEKTFYGCRRLRRVYLHKNIERIDRDAFGKCEKLIAVRYEGTADEYRNLKGGGGKAITSKLLAESNSYPLLGNVRTEIMTGRVKLTWDKIERAEGYRIYRIDGSTLKKVTDVKGTEYVFENLTSGQEYLFSVCAFYRENGEKQLSPQKEIVAVVAK